MKLEQLAGKKIAILGAGREGQAVRAVLADKIPELAVDVICESTPKDSAWINSIMGDQLKVLSLADAELGNYEILIKSPGISPYRKEIQQALAEGTVLTSGTNLWFAEHATAKTICITGTKGKSTSSALLSHLLRSQGQKTELVGNIGIPLMERWDTTADQWVIEMSSFQAADFNGLADIAVIVSLFAEHLDWHGNEDRYIKDKLNLLENSKLAVVNAADQHLLEVTAHLPKRVLFNHQQGWYQNHGDIFFAGELVRKSQNLPLRGHHNASNLCAVLTVIDLLGRDARSSLQALPDFVSLPHRLQTIGNKDGAEWINDSIATTPAAVIAAIDSMPADSAVILLVGGYDRGVDWSMFIDFLRQSDPNARGKKMSNRLHTVIGLPDNGRRILEQMQQANIGVNGKYILSDSLKSAVESARLEAAVVTEKQTQILLSPGAPSFSEFENFEQRGELFQLYSGL